MYIIVLYLLFLSTGLISIFLPTRVVARFSESNKFRIFLRIFGLILILFYIAVLLAVSFDYIKFPLS